MGVLLILGILLVLAAAYDSAKKEKKRTEEERDFHINCLLAETKKLAARLEALEACIEVPNKSEDEPLDTGLACQLDKVEELSLHAQTPVAAQSVEAAAEYLTEATAESDEALLEPSREEQEMGWEAKRLAWGKTISALREYAHRGTLWTVLGVIALVVGVAFLIQYTWSASPAAVKAAWTGGTRSASAILSFVSRIWSALVANARLFTSAEARLAFVALIAVALMAAGWQLRHKRRTHALIMQGVGIGLFYLTLFAASMIDGLLPVGPALALTALTIVCSGILALKQDSEALAWCATAVGFAAPTLAGVKAASGTVDHFWLFSYYSLLDLGVFAAAYLRSWRSLNLLGFIGTYVAAAAWCVFDYPLNNFFRVEPFFILFFLGYTSVTVRMILRGDFSLGRTTDAILLAGTPVAFCSLQFPLTWHEGDFAAITAYALGALYVSLGYFLQRRLDRAAGELGKLVKISLCTGIFFANVAIPLSLPPQGVAFVWLLFGCLAALTGIKLKDFKIRAAGATLQVAGPAFLFLFSASSSSRFLIGILAAFSSLSCFFAAMYASRKAKGEPLVASAPDMKLLFGWGLLWLYGLVSCWAFTSGIFVFPFYVLLAFFTMCGVFFLLAGQSFGSWFAQIPAAVPSLLALYLFASAIFEGHGPFPLAEFLSFPGGHPLAEMGALAWPIFFLGQTLTLTLLGSEVKRDLGAAEAWEVPLSYMHGGNFILCIMMVTAELSYWFSRNFNEVNLYWIDLLIVLFLALIVNVTASGQGIMARTSPVRRRNYSLVGCGALCMLLCLWAVSSFLLAGDSSPMTYLPLLNPLAFAEVTIFFSATWWHLRVARLYADFEAWMTGRIGIAVCTVLMMAFSTVETARIFHFYGGTPFTLPALWKDHVFQTTVTLLWGLWSLGMMRIGSKNAGHRRIWNIGAALLSCNIMKLFFADLTGSGRLTRVFSFLGLGVLLMVIGYLTPLPPKDKAPVQA
ncbi:MAG: DUF2339 domain-containing protein [Synergistaceae bacterium]|jgi:uncharacterized membrane protein|nr:DUF2339 domain-containing protein [Synergistaceae bacterium]